jgi:hypothetical protein
VLSLVSFFARAKKETRPRCGEPQLAVEIARAARDTIYTLDSRFRENDRKFRGSATHKHASPQATQDQMQAA